MARTLLNIDTAKSYATEANLLKAIANYPEDWRFTVVCNRQGRFTAIFPVSRLGSDVAGPARDGFLVIG